MFSGGILDLTMQLISTWQVIAVTVALVLYMFLIKYVAQPYHRPRSVSKTKARKAKTSAKKEKKEKPVDTDSEEIGMQE